MFAQLDEGGGGVGRECGGFCKLVDVDVPLNSSVRRDLLSVLMKLMESFGADRGEFLEVVFVGVAF